MWPRLVEYESRRNPFFFEFGLQELPREPGLILVRGPRQYGKSTWLDLKIRKTIEDFGKGTALYLNGDEILTEEAFHAALLELEESLPPNAAVRRIFIDEITSIRDWERAIKRAYDQGSLRKTLLVTTGSRAADLRHGAERLPGRRGKLDRTEYVFLPISYAQFYKTVGHELGGDAWKAYLLAGGAPLGCSEIIHLERVPEYFTQMIQDWVLGDVVSSGRSRLYLRNVLDALYRFAGTPVGFAKLAREAGMANNTVASGYVERLSDLLTVLPVWQWDPSKKRIETRKPCKFTFINLAVAVSFHSARLRLVHDFDQLPGPERAKLVEWLVAQELWRRRIFMNRDEPERLSFWRSKNHEIDYVVDGDDFYEVKVGKATALEYSWFAKVFPGKKLTVVCSTPFEGRNVRGVTLHEFLMEGPCLDFIRDWETPGSSAN